MYPDASLASNVQCNREVEMKVARPLNCCGSLKLRTGGRSNNMVPVLAPLSTLHTNCQPVYDLGAKDGTKRAIFRLISIGIYNVFM